MCTGKQSLGAVHGRISFRESDVCSREAKGDNVKFPFQRMQSVCKTSMGEANIAL